MPQTDIDSAEASNLTTAFANQADVSVDQTFKIDSASTDGAGDQKEFTWQMPDWSQNYGYYKKIPELQTAIDAKANWTVGAGFEADPMTTLQLSLIKGNGKDSFNSILLNMVRTYTIGGDAFAEIIKPEKTPQIPQLAYS